MSSLGFTSDTNSNSSSSNLEAANFGEDCLTLNSKKALLLDENVLRLRKTLYSLTSKSLKSIIMSPAELSRFREDLRNNMQNGREMSLETFTQTMFTFFNERLFLNLLDSITICWSKRFKS